MAREAGKDDPYLANLRVHGPCATPLVCGCAVNVGENGIARHLVASPRHDDHNIRSPISTNWSRRWVRESAGVNNTLQMLHLGSKETGGGVSEVPTKP